MKNINDFVEGKIKELKKMGTPVVQGELSHGIYGVLHDSSKLELFLRTFSQELIEKCGEEIIGEDELPEEYIAKHLTEIELDKTIQAVNFHARNKLRAEQRSHLKGISL